MPLLLLVRSCRRMSLSMECSNNHNIDREKDTVEIIEREDRLELERQTLALDDHDLQQNVGLNEFIEGRKSGVDTVRTIFHFISRVQIDHLKIS